MKHMKYLLLFTAWFGLSLAVFATEPPVKHLSRETASQVQEITKLHTQINRLSAVTVATAGVAVFSAPPVVVISGVAVIIRFFKVNKHRRLTNELLRKSL